MGYASTRAAIKTQWLRRVVEALRRMGHDVVTVADAGKAGQALTDKAILQLAGASQRAVVTLNRRHFVQLHTAEPTHAGIIVCSLDLDFEGQAARIDQAVAIRVQFLRFLRRLRPFVVRPRHWRLHPPIWSVGWASFAGICKPSCPSAPAAVTLLFCVWRQLALQ